jgi:hypothetical protein
LQAEAFGTNLGEGGVDIDGSDSGCLEECLQAANRQPSASNNSYWAAIPEFEPTNMVKRRTTHEFGSDSWTDQGFLVHIQRQRRNGEAYHVLLDGATGVLRRHEAHQLEPNDTNHQKRTTSMA